MAKPNFQYEKRQKELAKKKKQEEKRLAKLEKGNVQPDGNTEQTTEDTSDQGLSGVGESSQSEG